MIHEYLQHEQWITKLFTLTVEELWVGVKMATDFIIPMSDYLRKVFTELSNSSAAELLSLSKNPQFFAPNFW